MAKSKRYRISYYGRSVEMSRANNSILVYRFPYQNLKIKEESFEIDNPFIVYILVGKNDDGKDAIYVGKSKNGIKNRPTSHEDKYDNWTECFVLTQFKERTFFNDGTIQYIEDNLNSKINKLNVYDNKTLTTSAGTANTYDEEDCDEFIEEALEMLDILGLDLITCNDIEMDSYDKPDDSAEETDTIIPDGIYYLKRKVKREHNKTFEAKMQVADKKFIVLKGSMICPSEAHGVHDSVINKRNNAEIRNDILCEDVIFDSPSTAGEFVLGGANNGWESWKCQDGRIIDCFRHINDN